MGKRWRVRRSSRWRLRFEAAAGTSEETAHFERPTCAFPNALFWCGCVQLMAERLRPLDDQEVDLAIMTERNVHIEKVRSGGGLELLLAVSDALGL